MSVELVTGYYGVGEDGEPTRHVSSAEDGARQAGTLGLGCYALSTGSKLFATMEDANTLVVADGDVVMNGRHVSLPDPTSFTIPTGVHGQKVSNLAVLRYQKAADSVESVTPLVLTGEASADAPVDPTYNDGSILDGDSPVDMPLYRVVTDGVNAGEPEQLFEVVRPISGKADVPVPVSQGGTGSTTVDGALTALGLKTLKDNGPYVRAQASNMHLYTYSAIVSVADSQCVLLSNAQIQGIIGRSFNVSTDCVALMNGDWDNSGQAMVCAVYDQSSKSINMRCKEYGPNSSDINGTMRINIIIATR